MFDTTWLKNPYLWNRLLDGNGMRVERRHRARRIHARKQAGLSKHNCFAEGFNAFWAKSTRADNPYPAESDQAEEWEAGYTEATEQ